MSEPISEIRTLETGRCRLRPLVESDAGVLALYVSDARVARMTRDIPHPYPPGTAQAYVERHGRGAGPTAVWAIDLSSDESNGLIGIISLAPQDGSEAEVTFWVAPAWWGTGYAGEALEAVVAEARRRSLTALTAEVMQDNIASVKVLTRIGFGYVGEGSMHSVARNAVTPTFRYRMELV